MDAGSDSRVGAHVPIPQPTVQGGDQRTAGLCALEARPLAQREPGPWKEGPTSKQPQAHGPFLKTHKGHPKSELEASLLGPLLRRETEAWEVEHGELWSQIVQVGALDFYQKGAWAWSGCAILRELLKLSGLLLWAGRVEPSHWLVHIVEGGHRGLQGAGRAGGQC